LRQVDKEDILNLLKAYPELRIVPITGSTLEFKGKINAKVKYKELETLEFAYDLKIIIPEKFPNELPDFYMLDKSVKPDVNLHIEKDGKICLGVPLRLMMELNKVHTINNYIENVLIPYLYGLTYKLKYKKKKFPFDEIGHYEKGLLVEYKKMLQLNDKSSIIKAFELLGMDRGDAHFEKCPCGCGNLYMICTYMNILEKYRYLANKEWYIEQARKLGK